MEAHLNRSVIIIVPKKPFYDWINNLDPVHPIHDLKEYNSFLIEDKTLEKASEWMTLNYAVVFENELFGMWIKESDWPQERSFKVFNEWFDWHFSGVVIDTLDGYEIGVEHS